MLNPVREEMQEKVLRQILMLSKRRSQTVSSGGHVKKKSVKRHEWGGEWPEKKLRVSEGKESGCLHSRQGSVGRKGEDHLLEARCRQVAVKLFGRSGSIRGV